MRNFLNLASNVDVMPLLHAVQARQDLWNAETLRTSHGQSPHTQVDDIILRFNDLERWKAEADAASILDEHESVPFPGWKELPQAQHLVFDLMRRFSAVRLGRVLITRLKPGGRIEPHEDGGSHAAYYERVHIVLQGLPGSLFHCGGETVCMRTGEAWWFDNSQTHSVENNSADDRIHMIVDYRIDR